MPGIKEAEFQSAVVTERQKAPPRGRGLRFLNVLVILAKSKSFILKFVLAAVIGALAIVLLLPNTYTANAKALSSLGELPSSLTAAGLSAFGAGEKVAAINLQVAILRSDTIANRLIDRFSLLKVYGVSLQEKARHILAQRSEITGEKGTVISVSVSDRDPQRAANLANGYLEELERLANGLTAEQATKRKQFFQREAEATRAALTTAEQMFKQAQEKTKLVLLDRQTQLLLKASALLHAQVRLQELRVQSMDSFATPENPRRVLAETELAALREQQSKFESGGNERAGIELPLADVPRRTLEYVRALREVQYREAFFTLLSKEYETWRLGEAQAAGNTQQVVQVLDKAIPPERKSFPPRFLLVASAMLLSFFLAAITVLFRERLQRTRRRRSVARAPLFTYQLGEKQAIAPRARSKSA